MRLHVMSDLHLNGNPHEAVPVLGDALVLAGDIVEAGDMRALMALAINYRRAGLPVLYVPGNHEFYHRSMPHVLREMGRACRRNGVMLLHNRCVVLCGVRFFGATLWTDYKLEREARQAQSMAVARDYMGDHAWIYTPIPGEAKKRRTFQPEDALAAHMKSLRLMRLALEQPFDGPSVVISHHAPSPACVNPRFAGHPSNPAFASNLEPLMLELEPALWVHGHMHHNEDRLIGRTRLVCNPRGYRLRRTGEMENPGFDPHGVLQV